MSALDTEQVKANRSDGRLGLLFYLAACLLFFVMFSLPFLPNPWISHSGGLGEPGKKQHAAFHVYATFLFMIDI